MAFTTINGNVVHYELIGEAKAKNLIVFSNGLGTDFRIWLPLFDELGDDVSVLFYDSRGHGLSGGAEKPFGMADLAATLSLKFGVPVIDEPAMLALLATPAG